MISLSILGHPPTLPVVREAALHIVALVRGRKLLDGSKRCVKSQLVIETLEWAASRDGRAAVGGELRTHVRSAAEDAFERLLRW